MHHIVIVGGGFAGVWSAASAARVRGDAAIRITLVSPGTDLVLRPRLYEAEPERALVPLKRILEPVGVEHVQATVTEIDTAGRRVVTGDGEVLAYDRLVLATGSQLIRPQLPGAERVFDVDTLDGAVALRDHLRGRTGFTAVVVGAGFTGLEVATELAGRGRVILADRSAVVGPELGDGPRPAIEAALDRLGVERRLGTTVTEVKDGSVRWADGTWSEADAVIWTAGLRASPLTAHVEGPRDRLGRLEVDARLRVSPDVFAAGDTAAARLDAGHVTVQSCQYAVPMGRTAGHNAAADLLGLPLIDFAPGPYVTDIDLGGAGAVFTRGWDRRVESTGADGKLVKQWIMEKIHPPVDDAEEILNAAAYVYVVIPGAREL
ncbi:NADH dehydrogenase-like protein [Streptomyces sp. YIM 121038]|uniref:NAD(P)/FAD-dependent oxidoreductase n=1 Tax=Streptomyces sp. YIM 121038 TaxID=2136401 RepID=UPI0011109D80|nr:FAD-dependent oxidoreductase [Streptomyces sp. YIM 121038]QCX74093.1 NADH dehydrogenase-like protein [Streptomyces sp. YIM 121038]